PREFSDLTAEEQTEIVNRLSRTLDTTRRGLTNVISIRATAGSAQDAANRANAVAAAYLDEQISSRLDSAERAVKFLRSRVEGLASDISEGEEAVDRFVSTQLEKLDSPAARELLARIEAEHQSRLTSEAAFADLQSALREQDFERLVQLAEMPADIARQRQSLAQELRGSAVRVDLDQTRRQLADLDRQIREAAERRVSSLQVDMSLSDSRASNFRKQLESTLANQRLPAVVVNELDRLQRDLETRRSLYDSFLAKLRQVEQQTGFNMPDSRIIANATPPPYPSFPPTRLILAGAVLFSLGAGIGLAFLRENYLGGITDIDQFEAVAGIPVVASVPHIGGAREKAHLAIVEDPLSAFSEAIRRISTGIRGPTSSGKLCVFVTSTLPGDGKTTIALALARQFALTGSSTLMVDADLRHPSVHRLLNKDAGDGLISLLSRDDGSVVDQLIVTREAATNVHFVLAGDAGGVATDTLLMSRRFDDLMKFARQTYDVVVIDTPPVGLVVDAAIVARHCDAGVFIARYHSTMPQQVRASMRDLLLRAAGVPLYGVLNQVAWADSQVYGYGRYYRSRR
ncbi:MAG: GumC family protein, partial [Propylenella sp.]